MMNQATIKTAGTTDLADFLVSIGVDVRKVGQEISGCCPVHIARTGKVDRSPSWSMNADSGLWICYSCGARGTLNGLIWELTGKESVEASALLMNTLVDGLGQTRVEHVPDFNIQQYLAFSFPPQEELRKRRISNDCARVYGLRWSEERGSWIIPIITPDHNIIGWQEKAPRFVKNYPTGLKMRGTLFGIERFSSSVAILVESPLDVVRFASSFDGMQCLASFGASITHEQLQLLYSKADKVIVALDNDEAGIASAQKIFKDMPSLKNGVQWLKYKHTKAKDIGDMTDDEVYEAIMGASVIPWWV